MFDGFLQLSGLVSGGRLNIRKLADADVQQLAAGGLQAAAAGPAGSPLATAEADADMAEAAPQDTAVADAAADDADVAEAAGVSDGTETHSDSDSGTDDSSLDDSDEVSCLDFGYQGS